MRQMVICIPIKYIFIFITNEAYSLSHKKLYTYKDKPIFFLLKGHKNVCIIIVHSSIAIKP